MLATFKHHYLTLTAAVLTGLALFALTTRLELDSQWALEWNHLNLAHMQLVYIVLLLVALAALPFDRRIRQALGQGSLRGIIPLIAVVAAFFLISLLEPDQEHRLFITPFSIWVIIVHGLALAALAVLHTVPPSIESDSRLIRRGVLLLTVLGLILAVLYTISLREFMYLDLPDEPFNASIATNYAENNDLSTQYIGSAYGSPDVVFPRYYWVMGLWLKLADDSSLQTLRAFPLMVGAFTLVLFTLALWSLRRIYALSRLQILAAAVVLLSLSTFARTSHNLRMDVMLALYGSLMLWGMLTFWHTAATPARKRLALAVMGVALFLGMQGIPTTALPLSAAVGFMLVLWWLLQPAKQRNSLYVIGYAAACALGVGAYYLFQFLPDIAASWARYRDFVEVYTAFTGVGSVRFSLAPIESMTRFSLILAPAELILALTAFVLLWRRGSAAERWMLASLLVGFVLVNVLSRLAYSYLVIFTPFIAYALARALHPSTHRVTRLTAAVLFVCLPALAAPPILDMIGALQTGRNQSRLEAVAAITPDIPPGTTIIADDIFWFPLHRGRTVIGVNGFANYVPIRRTTIPDALQTLGVQALLCDANDRRCDELLETGLFAEPTEYTFSTGIYNLYWRK